MQHAMTFPQFAVLVLALVAIVALSVYEWMTRAKPVPLDAQELADLGATRAAIEHAVNDCALEYITVARLGYTSRDARAHLRAYAMHHYSMYSPGIRATIQRQAIHAARQRLNVFEETNMIDVNARPSYQ